MATIVGAVVQIVSLSVSKAAGNTKDSADTLVVSSASFSFALPVGDI